MEEKSNPKKLKIIVIIGPTSSGKSDLAVRLARKIKGEIISADSRQVYKGMDIGTGKVTKKEQKMAKHYLLDVASPKKTFTASDYKKLGEKAIKIILRKNKIPIIVGGTGFYIDTLLGIINLPEVPPNPKLRQRFDKLSAEHLFKMLRKLDPQRAKNIDAKNKRRLIRALEIISATGQPIPQLNIKHHELNTRHSLLWLGIKWPQKELEKRIGLRLDRRLNEGMIDEIIGLLKRGISHKRLYGFGLEYRQISNYLKTQNLKLKTNAKSEWRYTKNFKKSEYYGKLLREIIKYSKRQMTWFKRNPEIHWFTPRSVEGLNPKSKNFNRQAEKLTEKFLKTK